jgi:hypothetical protein
MANTLIERVNKETGEISTVKEFEWGEVEHHSSEQILTERFSLQGTVRKLMPASRTGKCLRLTTGGDVAVQKSIEHKTCSYSGLQTCGSVWACPVCSARVSVRRRNETIEAMEKHQATGGKLYFITTTFPHSNKERLDELRSSLAKALKTFRQSYAYKTYKKEVGYVGLIRALEVTYGFKNGWHPHCHEVVFAKNEKSFHSIKSLLFPSWKKACLAAGLPAPSFRRGIDVKGGEKAGDYINKFGNELAMSHMKKARSERFTPFDLLRGYHHENDKQLGAKFVEYAEGMKGARQLYWTNGLKSQFDIDEKTDEELAAKTEDKHTLLGKIDKVKWRGVVSGKARATVLLMSQKHGFSKAEEIIEALWVKYVSSGKKASDDLRMEKYKAKQREKECRPEPPTQEQRDAVVVKLQEVFAANRLMAEQAKSRKEWISKSTQDWIDENLSNIYNPYHGKK